MWGPKGSPEPENSREFPCQVVEIEVMENTSVNQTRANMSDPNQAQSLWSKVYKLDKPITSEKKLIIH